MEEREKGTNFIFFRNLGYDIKNNKALLLMSIPGIILVLLFAYYPMAGIVIAFQDYSLFQGIGGSEWVGFENFTRFFADPYFFRLLKNTFLLGFYNLLWSFPAPIILALLLNEVKNEKFKRITQTISYMPYFVSVVIIVGLMRTLFATNGGVINTIIQFFGGNSISFFNQPEYFRSLYIGSGIWQGIGYGSIIYLAAITGIDQELYEAAKVDGASRLRCVFSITIPCIIPTIAVLFTMNLGGIINVGFEKVLLMYSPATYNVADVISTYVYRKGMLGQDFGFASAVGLFNSIISVTMLIGANWFSKRVFEESLW